MTTLNELGKKIHETSKKKGWYDTPREVGTYPMLIVSEIAEATESARKGEPAYFVDEKGKPDGESVELADAMIRILDYCAFRGFDIDFAIKTKMEYNETRSYRHGNKQF